MHRLALVSAVVFLAACSKSDPPGSQSTATTGSVATTASAAPHASSAPAVASAAPAAAPAAAGASATAGSFAGKYTAKASSLYLPDTKEMQRVKWRGDESTEGLGAGELTLTIAADGSVQGESTGPLGAMVLVGQAQGDTLAATLQRKTATDGGFTGTLHAKKNGAGYAGEMNLSRHDASVLRTATFELASK